MVHTTVNQLPGRQPPSASATMVFDTYWEFATERQAIYFKRVRGESPPWTTNAILARHRFTNVYRAADRVTQFLIRHVIYGASGYSGEDQLFRILLFKIFNKIETWRLIEEEVGDIRYRSFDYRAFDRILTKAYLSNRRLYSAAYIMPSASVFGSPRKHQNHLQLLSMIFRTSLAKTVAKARSMHELFESLADIPSFGPFLAYQYAIDINYSELTDFTENDFVMPGPGAIRGIQKCFPTSTPTQAADVIRWVCDRQRLELDSRELPFESLWGRPLHLIDVQNLFCEVDKYSRVAHPAIASNDGRKRIKQLYRLSPRNSTIQLPWFPPKWNLNHRVTTQEI